MRASYCYVPFLPARGGAFRAVAALSPSARSRLTPLFNIPATVLKGGKTWEAYFTGRVEQIRLCWEPARAFYIDVHDLDLSLRTSTGRQPIEFLISHLRRNGMQAIPVTGTEADRGKEYLLAVKALVARYGSGSGLRLTREELEEPALLARSVKTTLASLEIDASHCDAFIDFGYVGKDKPEVLKAMTIETLAALNSVGQFRNVAFGGSSIPDQLGKQDHGVVRREKRVEFEVWEAIRNPTPLAFMDYGVVGAHYVPPARVVKIPSRIRYTTSSEHVFRRANRNDYKELCKQVVTSTDFAGGLYSDGDRRIQISARGLSGPGAPAIWVAYDTNHHLEFVADQTWSRLRQLGLANDFALAEPLPRPWLQPELLDELMQ